MFKVNDVVKSKVTGKTYVIENIREVILSRNSTYGSSRIDVFVDGAWWIQSRFEKLGEMIPVKKTIKVGDRVGAGVVGVCRVIAIDNEYCKKFYWLKDDRGYHYSREESEIEVI